MSNIDYSMLPSHMRGIARDYIERGYRPGHFLTAVICGDLFEAYGRADEDNTYAMREWVLFFYNEAPSSCFGNKEIMEDWIKLGGLSGIYPHLSEKEEVS